MRSVVALGLCLVLGAGGARASSENPRAVTLAGNEVTATEDLGARSLLVVTFHRVEPRVDASSVYTVIVLEGAPGFVRRMVVRALRGDVPAARQNSFLVVEEGADAWRELAGSNGEEEDRADAVFVVRLENGEVCGRYRGLVSGVALSDLLSASCEG